MSGIGLAALCLALASPDGGVVVGGVARHSEAARAGLRGNDVILGWSQGSAHGSIASPSDLWALEIERAPLGAVTLEGMRGADARTWELGQSQWGLSTRPGAESQATTVWRLAQAADRAATAKRWGETDRAYQEASTRAAPLGPRALAELYWRWAQTYAQRADWAHAERSYQRAWEESQKLGGETLLGAFVLQSLGNLFFKERDDRVTGETYLRKAFVLRETLAPNSLVFARSINSAGTLELDRDPPKADELYRRAHELAERIAPESSELAAILNNQGCWAINHGQLDRAEEHLLQALAIEEKHESNGAVTPLVNLGVIALDRGDLTRADDYFRRAYRIHQALGHQTLGVATVLHNLGDVAVARGDSARAEELYLEALDLEQKLAPDQFAVAPTLNFLGNLARRRGHLDDAEKYYQRALAIERRTVPQSQFVADPLHGLGDVYRARRDLARAASLYEQALVIREREIPGSTAHAESLAALGGLEREKGDLEAASRFLSRALAALENQTAHLGGSAESRSNFRAEHDAYYRDYVDLLMQKAQPEGALQVLERSRARSLLETLWDSHVDIRRGADPQLVLRERALQQTLADQSNRRVRLLEHGSKVAELDKQLDGLRDQLDEVQRNIRLRSPDYAQVTQPQPLEVAQIQKLLDQDTVLVEYALGAERSYVWVVGPSSVAGHVLAPRRTIEDATRRLYALLTAHDSRARAKYPQAVAELGRLILSPVAALIAGKRLLVVSDGALQYIPFAILSSDGKLLIEQHEIAYLPSASVLAALRREGQGRKQPAKAVAVLADPVFDGNDGRVQDKRSPGANLLASSTLLRSMEDFGATRGMLLRRLRFSRREAEAILAVTPAQQALKALDFDATRVRALSPELADYRIVHFATHGLLDSRRPELSGLVMSMVDEAGRPQNGYVGLRDIYNLNLPVELVVLSACETGLGKEIAGEGLVGLTRGFMYAGARRVVASLWKVDDIATAELMSRFYRAMQQDGLPPVAALRRAQIEMAHHPEWSFPYYWGAFAVHGDWQ